MRRAYEALGLTNGGGAFNLRIPPGGENYDAIQCPQIKFTKTLELYSLIALLDCAAEAQQELFLAIHLLAASPLGII